LQHFSRGIKKSISLASFNQSLRRLSRENFYLIPGSAGNGIRYFDRRNFRKNIEKKEKV
jgi:hypothetical protein